MDSESYLSVLNEEQRAAVEHDGKSLLILAGAGSGKTRVITTKIAYLISQKHVDPYSILAVTFTKKAANEMRERAVALEPLAQYAKIRTFHSWGAYFLRANADAAGVDKNFTVYDDDDMATLISKAMPDIKRQQASRYAKKIALAKDYCLSPDSDMLYQITDDPLFPSVYKAYEERLKTTGNVDFGDLIMKPYLLLKENDFIRHQCHSRYRVIMVDEYQDSNVAQFLLLQQLSGVMENSGTYVCVVGDDDQSIYKFRGAQVQNILEFQNQFPGTSLIRLQTNYRSTAQILSCADNVVSNNEGRLGKTLVSARGDGKKPTLVFLPSQDDETQFCAQIIRQAYEKGIPYSHWAVLYRTNAQSLGFESEFLRSHIPYNIVGSLKFYEREEIKDALSWISFIANTRDEIAFRRIVNKPVRGIGPGTQDKIVLNANGRDFISSYSDIKLTQKAKHGMDDFAGIVKQLHELLESNPEEKLSLFIENVVTLSGLAEYHKDQDDVAGTQRITNLEELVNSAVLYPCSMEGLLAFLDSIQLDRLIESGEESDNSDRVTLITLHNTKGLEFPRVIITGMESGIFPREDKMGEDLEEERRLFYVGITRAKDELYFTSCAVRRMYGRINYMSPSIFLRELGGKDNIRILGDSSVMENERQESLSLEKKYAVGTNLYHDDYGHGQVIYTSYSDDGEFVITVRFETGGSMKFLPKYQSRALMVVS